MATLLDGPCQFFLDFRRFVVMASRKLGIDAGVMDLGTTFAIPVDRQFLPLATQIEDLQNIVEDLQQTQLRRRPTPADGKMRQDELLKQCETQLRRNRLPT